MTKKKHNKEGMKESGNETEFSERKIKFMLRGIV